METGTYKIKEYIRDLSSKSPVPGGGGASALIAAIGISLGQMAANLTLGKKQYASSSEELKSLIQKAENLSDEFLRLADEDAKAFEPLSKAYALDKNVPENHKILEECLKVAARYPFNTLQKCCLAVDLMGKLKGSCSPIAISDVATGACICRSALMGAYVNVKVNTRLMSDRAYADKLDREAYKLKEEYSAKAERIYEEILSSDFKRHAVVKKHG